MLENLPPFISMVFALTTVLTLVLFYWTLRNSNSVTVKARSILIVAGLLLWLLLQAVLTLSAVYHTNLDAVPPKILLYGVLPAVVVIIALFATKRGRYFIDSLPLRNLTYLHVVRVPVELVLFWLFLNQAVPELMTFEGRNFDILAGITAPLVAYLGLTKGKLSRKAILIWNFVCLGLLLNIVINALLAAPTPLQKFAFDQPNIGVLYFPFSWLPSFIVPVVLFAHLVSIRQLI